MKIALVGTTANSILGFRRDVILSLVSQGHAVYAFAVDYTEQDKLKVQELGAVPMDYSLSRTGLNPLRDLRDTLALSRKLKEIKPDLMFSFFAKPVIYGSVAAKLAGIPQRIGMLEGLGFTFTEQPFALPFKTKLIRWIQVQLYRASIPLLDKIIFLNPDDPKDLLEKYSIKAKQVEVLGGIGLNLADYPYSPAPSEPVRFIFIGRLLAEKGVNEYIAAAHLVRQRYPEAEFVMLGGLDEANPGGLTREELEMHTAKGTVIYPGHVNNVDEWLASSSVFVLPSYYREGVPRSTQEAMAIGRAVITTDVPGCRETVVDGVNGFFVPPWSPEQLAEKMIRFIEQPELIEQMGKESYRIAQVKFDIVKVNEKLLRILGLS